MALTILTHGSQFLLPRARQHKPQMSPIRYEQRAGKKCQPCGCSDSEQFSETEEEFWTQAMEHRRDKFLEQGWQEYVYGRLCIPICSPKAFCIVWGCTIHPVWLTWKMLLFTYRSANLRRLLYVAQCVFHLCAGCLAKAARSCILIHTYCFLCCGAKVNMSARPSCVCSSKTGGVVTDRLICILVGSRRIFVTQSLSEYKFQQVTLGKCRLVSKEKELRGSHIKPFLAALRVIVCCINLKQSWIDISTGQGDKDTLQFLCQNGFTAKPTLAFLPLTSIRRFYKFCLA